MSTSNSKRKLALLTNIIAPYRLPLYSILEKQFDVLVLYGGTEVNRESWTGLEHILSNAKVIRALGWQIRYAKKVDGKVFDEKFIHVTPGLFWHLWRFRPDAIISSEMGFRSMAALAYGTLFRKPVWIWWEGTLHSERSIDPLRRLLRKVFTTCAGHWITCGRTSTEYLLSVGVKRERILQSQNSVDEERFQAEAAPAWSIQPRPVVLYVGQFIDRKGVGPLLDAAATLQRQGYEFSLLLVGGGRNKHAHEQHAQALGLKNVYFCPVQTPEKMPSVYRSADLMVFPTLEDTWGFVANEAILSGIPVLCSKYAGCAPELFSPESIFASDNADEFVEKLRQAVSGQLPKPDATRLKTTLELSLELIQELNGVMADSSELVLPNSAGSSVR